MNTDVPFPVFVEAYPWDFVCKEGEDRLERLRGESGVTGVTLHATCPDIVAISVREDGVRAVQSSSGLTFRHDEGAIAALRCKPVAASAAVSGEALRRAIDTCVNAGLGVRFAVSLAQCSALVRSYDEYAAENALGTKSGGGLCISHDEVRDYSAALTASLTRLVPQADLVLTDVYSCCEDIIRADAMGDLAELDGVSQMLSSWCFCQTCSARASETGVDVDVARNAVQAYLRASLEGADLPTAAHGATDADDSVLQAYWAAHGNSIAALLNRIRSNGASIVLAENNLCDVSIAACGLVDAFQLFVGHSSDIESTATQSLPSLCPGGTGEDAPESGAECPNEIVFPAKLMVGDQAAELTAALKVAVDSGVRSATVRHLGVISDGAAVPLKQAIRFARRAIAV